MGQIRMHVKDDVHFITNRTEHEQFMLLPTKEVNQAVLFWLTKSMVKYGKGIKIFAFVFMSNHFHILLQDTEGQIPKFMGYMQSNIAVSINRLLGRKGRFWSREYDDVIVDGENEFWNRYDYINANPVKAGLVAIPDHWRGVNSYNYSIKNTFIKSTGINRTKFNDAQRLKKKTPTTQFEETHQFTLTHPSAWKYWSVDKRATAIKERTQTTCKIARKERLYKKPLGMKKVLQQSLLSRPKQSKRTPRFRFFSLNKDRLKELNESYRKHVSSYKTCMNNMFSSISKNRRTLQIEWPPWSYPPTQHVAVGF